MTGSRVYTSFCLTIPVYKFGNETLNGNCSVGQLTKIGFGQQMQNGQTLYNAYVSTGFLNPNLSSSEVYVRSDGKFIHFVAFNPYERFLPL